jgi:uncharacterized membrane protein YcaP (DUF421 family)
MKKEDIDILDYMRILFGQMPVEFQLEVVIRVAFVYVLLVTTMRVLGPRMEAMISRNEEIALVTLAASVGILIHNPDRGILPAVIVIIVVVLCQYISVWLMKRSNRWEEALLDVPETLASEGCLQLKTLKETRIQKERLVSELRAQGLFSLGEVQRAYLEANGDFSVLTYEEKKQRFGLCLLPNDDVDFRSELKFSNDHMACTNCGCVATAKEATVCPQCESVTWEKAVITKD